MKKIGNHWVPDADARGRRNKKKMERMYVDGEGSISPLIASLEKIRSESPELPLDKLIAIDAGANVGSYTRVLADNFAKVYSFEPSPDTFACLERNVYDWGILPKVHHYMAAVSDERSQIKMGRSFGRLSITSKVSGSGDIPAIPLDSLGLRNVGFIKLDVEGFELKALIGAQNLIETSKPYVLMEVKPEDEEKSDNPYAAHKFLVEMGCKVVLETGRNWLYQPKS